MKVRVCCKEGRREEERSSVSAGRNTQGQIAMKPVSWYPGWCRDAGDQLLRVEKGWEDGEAARLRMALNSGRGVQF